MLKEVWVLAFALIMLSSVFAPARTWVYPNGSTDDLYEAWGPRATDLLIKLYASHADEMAAIDSHQIDIADDTLTPYDVAHFGGRDDLRIYNCSTGSKIMSRYYAGSGTIYSGEDWCGVVNGPSYGIDCDYSFLNMHTSMHECGTDQDPFEITYGFCTPTISSLNPLYAISKWDNKVLGLIGYESLLKRDPYTSSLIPWVAKTYSTGTYLHPTFGVCSKVVFTLRNDVYWSDGTQLSLVDVKFTFLELNKLLARRGYPPPLWLGNVAKVLDFKIYDPLNFEVLFDSVVSNADELVGLNRILPKHIWNPICLGDRRPKDGNPWDPTTFAPDVNMVGSGPWRLKEYVQGNHISLVRNVAGLTIANNLADPNWNAPIPTTSIQGFFNLSPICVDVHVLTPAVYRCKLDPGWGYHNELSVNFSISVANLWFGGSLSVDRYIYVDNALVTGPVSLNLANASDAKRANITYYGTTLERGMHTVKAVVKLTNTCSWQNASINDIQPIWIAWIYDITGSYYVDTQLLAPNCKMDLKDVFLAGKAYGGVPGNAKWTVLNNNGVADINNDYKIDLQDYYAICKHYYHGW